MVVVVDDPDFGIAAALEATVSDSSLRAARRQIEEELADPETDISLDDGLDVAAAIEQADISEAALADTQAALEAGLDPVTVDVEAREGGLTDPLLAGGAGGGVGAVLEEDVDTELNVDPSFDLAATITETTVTDAALADIQAGLEGGLDPVTVNVEAQDDGVTDPLLAGGAGVGVGDLLEEDVDPELADGPGEQVGAGVDDVGASIPDGGESGLSLGGAGELALQQEQLEQLEEINEGVDDLEGAGGGGGLLGGAAAGALGRFGGLTAAAVLAAGTSVPLGLEIIDNSNIDANAEEANVPEDERLPPPFGQATAPFNITKDIIDVLTGEDPADSEDTQSATSELDDRRNIPESIAVEDLREGVREDLGLEDAEPGTTVDTGALLEQLDSVTSGFDGLVADLTSVSQDFLTAGDDLAAVAAALEDFPSSLASALPDRPETESGETLPRSPVDRSEGEPGARGSGRPPGRGRLAPGPNAGGTRDIGTDSQGNTTNENQAAKRKRQQQSVDVTNEITVEASGGGLTREQQRELDRELNRLEQRLERRLSGPS